MLCAVREFHVVFKNEIISCFRNFAACILFVDYFKFFRDSFLVVAANDLTFLIVREKAELRHSHNGTVRAGSGEKRVENAVHFKRGKPQRIFLIVINGVFIAAA